MSNATFFKLAFGIVVITILITRTNKVEGEVFLENTFVEKLSSAEYVFSEYDIRKYATAKNHESTIEQILKTMPIMEGADEIDRYIQKKGKGSKVTGKMVLSAAKEYDVDHHMMLAIMQLDSHFGTRGKGARSTNPGNVGNHGVKKYYRSLKVEHHKDRRVEHYKNEKTTYFHTWDHGVRAVAKWLSKKKKERKRADATRQP